MYPVVHDNWMIYKNPEGAELFFGNIPVESVNGTGAEVLALCDGDRDFEQICQLLASKYNDQIETVQALVQEFINSSQERGIVKMCRSRTTRKPFVAGNSAIWAPYAVTVELTKKCDLRCIHCYAEASPTKLQEFNFPKLIEVLEDFHKLGTLRINLTGGEPFSYADIISVLSYCEGKFRVVITSNGFRIDEATIKLISGFQCIDHIQISLDGPDAATHDRVRGVSGSFEKAKRAIELLADCSNFNVHVGMMVLPQNIDKIEETVILSKALGAAVFGCGRIFEIGRAIGKFNIPKDSIVTLDKLLLNLANKYNDESFFVRRRDLGDFILDAKQNSHSYEEILQFGDLISELMGGNCGAGYRSLFISSNGSIYPCSMMEVTLGNIFDKGIKKALKSKLIQESFRNIKAPNREVCGGCENRLLCAGCMAQACIYGKKTLCQWRNNYERLLCCVE